MKKEERTSLEDFFKPQTRSVKEILEKIPMRDEDRKKWILLAINTDAVANPDQERWIKQSMSSSGTFSEFLELIGIVNNFRG